MFCVVYLADCLFCFICTANIHKRIRRCWTFRFYVFIFCFNTKVTTILTSVHQCEDKRSIYVVRILKEKWIFELRNLANYMYIVYRSNNWKSWSSYHVHVILNLPCIRHFKPTMHTSFQTLPCTLQLRHY